MDWARYRELCDQPEYWSRWMLEQCLELFRAQGHAALAEALTLALATQPLERPQDFSGPASTHMFHMALPPQLRREGCTLVERAAAAGLTTSGTSQRGLGGFVEAWREYSRQACPDAAG